VRAAIALALTGGFGLGAALFGASALHIPLGRWWPAAAQAHGHLQLVGWTGLLVLGVGFHFLPRLRGAPLAHPGRARAVLWLLLVGLALRGLAQPTLAAIGTAPAAGALRATLLAAAVLELLGATLALDVLARTLRGGPPLAGRSGLRAVMPLFGMAFAAFWLALAVNLWGVVAALRASNALVASQIDRAGTLLALYGFLVPVGVAMSARLFPLYFRTPPPRQRWLQGGLGCVGVGLGARLLGTLGALPGVAILGQLALALGLILFIGALGIFARHRPLPRQPTRLVADPAYWHALTAYLWLVGTAGLLLWRVCAAIDTRLAPPSGDAEVHALGAGFLTLLILGVGPRLLSGFARRPVRHEALLWLTLGLANVSALLRIGPLLFAPLLPTQLGPATLAIAGLAGEVAVALFALNLGGRAPKATARTQQARPV
jgi:uncharacterized protein involved in response to NO